MKAAPPASTAGRGEYRAVIIAPTYNHARSLGAFLPGLGASDLPCIAVDDGSTDTSAEVLAAWREELPEQRWLIRHDSNRGKAAALQSGFELAMELGYTHALTIDTDGQHDPDDIPALLRESEREPCIMVIGSRDSRTPGYPLRSRVGRRVSSALVWLASGQLVDDSQSGMRVYPLSLLARIRPRADWSSRYGFETEVLTRLGFHGIGCIERPIRCIYQPRGVARSHFRVIGDSCRALAMHAKLLGSAFGWGTAASEHGTAVLGTMPRRLLWWFDPGRLVRMAKGNQQDRRALAASLAWGAFMAVAPLYGVKTIACLWLSRRFSLHPLVVVSVSSISSPPVGLFIIAASIGLGSMLLHGTPIDTAHWSSVLATVRDGSGTLFARLQGLLLEWLVGGTTGAVVLGLLVYVAGRSILVPARDIVTTRAPDPPRA